MSKITKINLEKEKADEVINTLLDGGTVQLHGDSKHFLTWEFVEKKDRFNYIHNKKGSMLLNVIKPTQYFKLWLKAKYREKK